MKAVGMGERTGSKVMSRGHQWATGGSALIPPPLHQSEYAHPRLGLFLLTLPYIAYLIIATSTLVRSTSPLLLIPPLPPQIYESEMSPV